MSDVYQVFATLAPLPVVKAVDLIAVTYVQSTHDDRFGSAYRDGLRQAAWLILSSVPGMAGDLPFQVWTFCITREIERLKSERNGG